MIRCLNWELVGRGHDFVDCGRVSGVIVLVSLW